MPKIDAKVITYHREYGEAKPSTVPLGPAPREVLRTECGGRTGRWMWSELEVCKIMGWKRTDMFLRYASLRGEDFADRML